MMLDRPVFEGGIGDHGTVRHHAAEYESDAKVRFVFDPATGINGAYGLGLGEFLDGRHCMRHVLAGYVRGRVWLLFSLMVEPLHDAAVGDMFDDAEREATGTLTRLTRWSLRVRLSRQFFREGKLATDDK